MRSLVTDSSNDYIYIDNITNIVKHRDYIINRVCRTMTTTTPQPTTAPLSLSTTPSTTELPSTASPSVSHSSASRAHPSSSPTSVLPTTTAPITTHIMSISHTMMSSTETLPAPGLMCDLFKISVAQFFIKPISPLSVGQIPRSTERILVLPVSISSIVAIGESP